MMTSWTVTKHQIRLLLRFRVNLRPLWLKMDDVELVEIDFNFSY